ncbi:MAG: nucleoside hydrolase [Desulfovibrio sp.]|nr:nucleoside hydrolase [Desulfovibrio sp.]
MHVRSLCALLILAVFLLSTSAYAAEREKVLLDTDMVEFFDDGVAMVMLASSPRVELLGITTLSGNSWVEEGTAYTIRQLELLGRTDIPVAMGLAYPFRPQRHELFEVERMTQGMGHDAWLGSFGLKQPASWQEFYRTHYGKEPTFVPVKQHAVDFIIDTVRANPGQVTIAAIGPCGNLAMAVRKAPDIIPLIKRVIYMGGAFFQPGNVTPAAEFNWWFDPEAAKIAVRTPFKEQIAFGLDVCEKVVFRQEHFDRFLRVLGAGPMSAMLRGTFVGQMFAKDPGFTHYVWDVLVAAAIIDPTLITREVRQRVDINDQTGLSYGQSLAYPKFAPKGCQEMRIVLDVDVERFWNMVADPAYWSQSHKK